MMKALFTKMCGLETRFSPQGIIIFHKVRLEPGAIPLFLRDFYFFVRPQALVEPAGERFFNEEVK